ncbi:uncharacterized protein LOC108865207 [Galendromus occidentalis]|uniref:Uncharacterized protein LOC108865207 n=1 Tax=Galendromus occidentalis TaxID=34638 RepID=A0AAJ7L6P8_9ACAR|nr:uncharacterized protein LOC108865207 [Galendromus occidentalis]
MSELSLDMNLLATDLWVGISTSDRIRSTAITVDGRYVRTSTAYTTYECESGSSERFLLRFGDSGIEDEDRILVFGRETASSWVGYVQILYVDGTFSLAPDQFAQVFVILADRGGYAIPLCYALLPNKSENSYRRMIGLVIGAFSSLDPASITMDFEMAVINAFIAAFPNAEIHGCLFHLVKSVKKKLSSLNLLKRYNADSNFSLWSRMIPAMAFVREDLLDRSMMALLEVLPEELKPVYTYFVAYVCGRILSVRLDGSVIRDNPLFSSDVWSVHEKTLNGESRTNNFAEAAHRKLQEAFGVCHPSVWKFIDGLRHVQHKADAELERYIIGSAPAPKRRRYLNADANLLELVRTIENREPVAFLRGIANNFLMDN